MCVYRRNLLAIAHFVAFGLVLSMVSCPSTSKSLVTDTVSQSSANTATTQQTVSTSGLTLDQAIKEASVRIDERIMKRTKIALVNFSSSTEQFSIYVLNELSRNLVESRNLTVVDRQEIDLRRKELDFQMSGEVSDDSMQSLGRTLGAQEIVSGSLQKIGNEYRIMIRVLNVESGVVSVQYGADIVNDRRVASLLERQTTPQNPFVGKWRTSCNIFGRFLEGPLISLKLQSIVEFKGNGTFYFEQYQFYQYRDNNAPPNRLNNPHVVTSKLNGYYWIEGNKIKIALNNDDYVVFAGDSAYFMMNEGPFDYRFNQTNNILNFPNGTPFLAIQYYGPTDDENYYSVFNKIN